jgi:hypothetical protein
MNLTPTSAPNPPQLPRKLLYSLKIAALQANALPTTASAWIVNCPHPWRPFVVAPGVMPCRLSVSARAGTRGARAWKGRLPAEALFSVCARKRGRLGLRDVAGSRAFVRPVAHRSTTTWRRRWLRAADRCGLENAKDRGRKDRSAPRCAAADALGLDNASGS